MHNPAGAKEGRQGEREGNGGMEGAFIKKAKEKGFELKGNGRGKWKMENEVV